MSNPTLSAEDLVNRFGNINVNSGISAPSPNSQTNTYSSVHTPAQIPRSASHSNFGIPDPIGSGHDDCSITPQSIPPVFPSYPGQGGGQPPSLEDIQYAYIPQHIQNSPFSPILPGPIPAQEHGGQVSNPTQQMNMGGMIPGYPYGGPPPDLMPHNSEVDPNFSYPPQMHQPFSPSSHQTESQQHRHPSISHAQGQSHAHGVNNRSTYNAGGNNGNGGQIQAYRSPQHPNLSYNPIMSPQHGSMANQQYYAAQAPSYWAPAGGYTNEHKRKGGQRGHDYTPRLSLYHSQAGPTSYVPPHTASSTYFAQSPVNQGFGHRGSASYSAPGHFGIHQNVPPNAIRGVGQRHSRGGYNGAASSYNTGTHSGFGDRITIGSRRRHHEDEVPRSAILEEFRLSKMVRRWELREIFGHIVEFSGDQHGSRFIQTRLETCSSEDRQHVFDEVLPNAYQLMTDVFGNYVIQKMLELGDQRQKAALGKKMEGQVFTLSMQMYGCRVVQKALQHILVDQRDLLVVELENHVLECVKSNNANHVIQLLIALGPPDSMAQSFVGNVEDLSMNPFGCRVMQKAFEHLPIEIQRPLFEELHGCADNLMEDQFGNYVIQTVLEIGLSEDRNRLINRIKGNLLQLCRHKFASNVCEKALLNASPVDRRVLIDELVGKHDDGSSNVPHLMRDAYANFPLQTALNCAEDDQRDTLLALIRPEMSSMPHTPVTKRLMLKIHQWENQGIIGPGDQLATPNMRSSTLHTGEIPPRPSLSPSTSASGYTPNSRGSSSTGITSPTRGGVLKLTSNIEDKSGLRTSASTPVKGLGNILPGTSTAQNSPIQGILPNQRNIASTAGLRTAIGSRPNSGLGFSSSTSAIGRATSPTAMIAGGRTSTPSLGSAWSSSLPNVGGGGSTVKGEKGEDQVAVGDLLGWSK